MKRFNYYINICILGGVSVGKSTLINTLFCDQLSDTKIKRTTMTPQIYVETKNIKNFSSKRVLDNNRKLNQTADSKNVIFDTVYDAPLVKSFIELNEHIGIKIYDIPGLNDSLTKDEYYQYVVNNFDIFDLVIFVLDINSAMNTRDQTDMLKMILQCIKKKVENCGVYTQLVVLLNKCDDISMQNDDLILDEEYQEIYDQAILIINKTIENIIPKLKYNISPISLELAYIYRSIKYNADIKFDEKHYNKIGILEFGKLVWTNANLDKKQKMIRSIDISEDKLAMTGFNKFKNILTFIFDKIEKKDVHMIKNQILVKIYRDNIFDLKSVSFDNMIDINMKLLVLINDYNHRFNTTDRVLVDVLKETVKTHCGTYLEYEPIDLKSMNEYNECKKVRDDIYLLYANFPSIYKLLRLNEKQNRIIYSMNKYLITMLSRTKNMKNINNIDNVITLFDDLIDNDYADNRTIIIEWHNNKIFCSCSSEYIIDHLELIRDKYNLSVDDMIEIVFNIIDTIYTQELQSNTAQAYFDKIIFWQSLMIRSTNKYSKRINQIKYILNSSMIKLNSEHTQHDTKIENHLYSLIVQNYPKDISCVDNLLDVITK